MVTEVLTGDSSAVSYATTAHPVFRTSSPVGAVFEGGSTVAGTIVERGAKFRIYEADRDQPRQRNSQLAQKALEQIPGNVTGFDDVSVACSLSVRDKKVQVALPRALFVDGVELGLPINVSISEDGGIRRPRVTKRTPDPAVLAPARARIQALIQKL